MNPTPHFSRRSRIRDNLHLRADLLRAVRAFFHESNFLEVDTPLRIPAPAPEQHIEAVGSEGWALQTSPELCMKRLLAAGFPKIYQICKCFRGRERGRKHLPEFTLLEWYQAGIGYHTFMDQCEALIRAVTLAVTGKTALLYQGRTVDLTGPWDRLPVAEAFKKWSPLSMEEALHQDRFDEIMDRDIEPNLGFQNPVFLCDYPAERGALARLGPDPSLAQRFELYICGLELCNGFMELTDPEEQRQRFEKERADMRLRNKPVFPMPDPFLEDLPFMPDAGGNALGLDRLAMLLCDAGSIDAVTAFTPEEL